MLLKAAPKSTWAGGHLKPSEAEWDAHRTYIEQLYRGHTLQELVDHMAKKRNFQATARMYKAKFKKWALRKNIGVREMVALADRLRDSELYKGRKPFDFQGRTIPVSRVRRYFRRKQLALTDLEGQQAVPTKESNAYIQTPRRLAAPKDFEIPERLLYDIDLYLKGTFEDERQRTICEHDCDLTPLKGCIHSSVLASLENLVYSALRISTKQNLNKASQAWACVSEAILSIIPAQDIHTYSHLCLLAQRLMVRGKTSIAYSILRQCSALTIIKQREGIPKRPLFGLYQNLLQLAPTKIEGLIPVLQLKATEALESIVGETHIESLNQRTLLYLNPSMTWRRSPSQSRALLMKLFTPDFSTGRRLLLALLQHLLVLLDLKDYDSLVRETQSWFDFLKDQRPNLDFREVFIIHCCLAISYDRLNEPALAQDAYQQAVVFAQNHRYTDTGVIATSLRWFDMTLRKHGIYTQAAEIRGLRYQVEDDFLMLKIRTKGC